MRAHMRDVLLNQPGRRIVHAGLHTNYTRFADANCDLALCFELAALRWSANSKMAAPDTHTLISSGFSRFVDFCVLISGV